MEVKQYAGKCKCSKQLQMRIIPIEKEADPKKEVMSWVIHGSCKECKTVYLQGLFFQAEEPKRDRDFIIDWNKVVEV